MKGRGQGIARIQGSEELNPLQNNTLPLAIGLPTQEAPAPDFPTWGGATEAIPAPFESAGGGDYGGAGSTGSWESSTTPGIGD